MKTLAYTHKDYMAKKCSHDEYYGQFGKHLISLVSRTIGVDKIKASTDPHFNDIPLQQWDNLAPAVHLTVGRMLSEANGSGGISLADCVCAAKAAAKIIKETK